VIKGLAHITGGGLMGNVSRILPQGLATLFHKGSWDILPIFKLIQKQGNIETAEMYRVFNMGIGMAIVCSPQQVTKLTAALPQARVIGKVIKTKGEEKVIID
jgi:phosphoribosylformylglycinamidine cyclo-ligase